MLPLLWRSRRRLLLACVLFAGQVLVGVECEVTSKFSLRNDSGEHMGMWWLEPGTKKKMIPQSDISIRHTSQTEINSFRGHRFVLRKWPKGKLREMVYVEAEDEAILTVGGTNDIIVFNRSAKIEKLDASWHARKAASFALDECHTDVECVKGSIQREADRLRDVWLEEAELREAMERDYVSYGGKAPKRPVTPPGGWPDRTGFKIDVDGCFSEGGLPVDPARYPADLASAEKLTALLAKWEVVAPRAPEGVCDLATLENKAFNAASKHDGRMCPRWARVGECSVNPKYMLKQCAWSCALDAAYNNAGVALEVMLDQTAEREKVAQCVGEALKQDFERVIGASSAEGNAADEFSESLRNLTCSNADATSGPLLVESKPYSSEFPMALMTTADGHRFNVEHLFRSDATQAANITLLGGFARPEECEYIISKATPNLHPATVNEEGDPSATNFKRRAQAAHVDFDENDPDDPVAKIWHRVFDAANQMTGYGLTNAGQEPFSIIHYNGTRYSESSSTEPADEYQPHCDGSCDSSPYSPGGRVATVLIYCAAPSKGGHTTFTNARTVVKPKANDAVFFSYYNKDTHLMDPGYTEHSGCPVLDGDKWVITLWMRKGLTKKHDWSSYDPTGARHDTA